MRAYHIFFVTHSVRIIVRIVRKKAIAYIIDVGDHDVYR